MSKFDVYIMAVRNLLKRKMRTGLTILGVVVGTASIVVMISLGLAINMNFEKQLENFGDITKIEIYNYSNYGGAPAFVMNDAVLDEIMTWEGVQVATPVLQTYIKTQIGKRSNDINIRGIRPEAMEALGYKISSGRLLQAGDEFQIVYGSDVIYEYMTQKEREDYWKQYENKYRGGGMYVSVSSSFGGESGGTDREAKVDVLNDKILASFVYGFGETPTTQGGETDPNVPVVVQKNLKPYEFDGVGILSGASWEEYYYCYMNIEQVKTIINDREKYEKSQGNQYATITEFDKTGYDNALVKCKDVKYVEDVYKKLQDMGFSYVYSPIDSAASMKEMSSSLQVMLAAIGGVSLFVATIGIANTMVMSIYERTREIGVMKVIGAALKDIRALFLVEAALIGLFGGAIGLGLSYGLSYILNNNLDLFPFLNAFVGYGQTAEVVSYIPVWLYASAILFSTLIGLVAGYFPARRAMKLSALKAIRSE